MHASIYYIIAIHTIETNGRTYRTDSSSPAAGAMIAAKELIENFREDYYNNNDNNNNIWYRFLFTFEHG